MAADKHSTATAYLVVVVEDDELPTPGPGFAGLTIIVEVCDILGPYQGRHMNSITMATMITTAKAPIPIPTGYSLS